VLVFADIALQLLLDSLAGVSGIAGAPAAPAQADVVSRLLRFDAGAEAGA
jgi:hypothetical protein